MGAGEGEQITWDIPPERPPTYYALLFDWFRRDTDPTSWSSHRQFRSCPCPSCHQWAIWSFGYATRRGKRYQVAERRCSECGVASNWNDWIAEVTRSKLWRARLKARSSDFIQEQRIKSGGWATSPGSAVGRTPGLAAGERVIAGSRVAMSLGCMLMLIPVILVLLVVLVGVLAAL